MMSSLCGISRVQEIPDVTDTRLAWGEATQEVWRTGITWQPSSGQLPDPEAAFQGFTG